MIYDRIYFREVSKRASLIKHHHNGPLTKLFLTIHFWLGFTLGDDNHISLTYLLYSITIYCPTVSHLRSIISPMTQQIVTILNWRKFSFNSWLPTSKTNTLHKKRNWQQFKEIPPFGLHDSNTVKFLFVKKAKYVCTYHLHYLNIKAITFEFSRAINNSH
jgi:hypothetical protein